MTVFELMAKIRLDSSEYERGLSEASSKTGNLLGKGLKTAAGVGAAAVTAATAAVVGFGAVSVKTGMNFDKSMSQVAATMGTTVDQIGELRDYAQEMGRTTAFSASEAADAMNYMALAGYDAKTTMAMLPNVLNLAAAGSIDLAYASDMITDSQSALGLTLDETTQLVDKMAKASSKSNTSVAQLGEAILTVGGTAKNLAGGTTELSTALGILADNGVKGSEGGTALRNVILSLSAPTDKAAKAMQKLGLEAFDANGDLRPMNEIFGDLNESLSSLTQEERTNALNDIFNKVDLKSVNALLGTSAERWEELAGAIDDSSGAAQQMAETQLDNLAGDITLFKSALEGAQIAISDKLTPSLREFVQFGSDGLSRLTEAFQEGGLSGAIDVFGNLVSEGIQLIMGKLPELVSAGAQLLVALARGIGQNLPLIAQTALDIILMLGRGIASGIPTVLSYLPNIIIGIVNFISSNLPAIVETGVQIILALAIGLAQAIPALIEAAPQILKAIWDGIVASIPIMLEVGPQIVDAIEQGIYNALSALGEIGIEILRSIVRGIANGMGMLGEIIASALGFGKDTADSSAEGFSESGGRASQALSDGFTGNSGSFGSTVSSTVTDGVNAANGASGGFTNAGSLAGANLSNGFTGSSGSISSAVSAAMSGAQGTAEGSAGLFTPVGSLSMENLASGFGTSGAVDGAITSTMSGAVSAGNAGAAQFTAVGQNVSNQLGAGVYSTAGNVATAVSSAVTSAIAAGNGAASGASAIGSNIARGIAAGISSGSGAIASAARSAVQAAVSAAKAAAAIASPSKKFRDEVGVFMGLGIAEGLEDSEDKVIKAAKDLAQKTYEKSKEWLRRQTKFSRLSLEDQLEVWQEIQSQYIKESKQWIEAEEEIFDIREKIQENFTDKTEKLWKKIADSQEKYTDTFTKRMGEIMGEYDLFDDVQDREAADADELTTNLLRQVNVLGSFYDELGQLAARGVGQEMIEEIRDMGPKAIDNLEALLSMTDDQLTNYVELFRTKQMLANAETTAELSKLKYDTDQSIQESLDSILQLYQDNAPTLGEALTAGIADGIKFGMSDVVDAAIDTANTAVVMAKRSLGYEAENPFLSSDWLKMNRVDFSRSGLGVSSAGVINGITSSTEDGEKKYTINLTMADGSVMARWIFDPLKNFANSKGQPIVNPA